MIHHNIPELREELKWNTPFFVKTKNICHIYFNEKNKYATLNFNDGRRLSDPGALLDGSGKKMRHLKIYKEEDFNRKVIAAWLRTFAEQERPCHE